MTKLTQGQLTDLRLLLSIDGIGPGRLRQLLSRFHSIQNILAADSRAISQTEGISQALAEKIINARSSRPRFESIITEDLKKMEKNGARIISVWDDEYPQLLKKIYDPPLLLYCKGTFTDEDNYSIAIVGTRQPTSYGKLQAEKIAADLAAQNVTVVSGLARGIDSAAHSSALKNNGRTIAVIGSGLDVIYPPENNKLFDAIAGNGCIISEYPPGTQPDAQNFPRRNRINAGLSLGCIVIETAFNGGAMQTASFALEQNREVFALPGNVGIRQSEGTNLLIRKGEAALIQSAEDVLLDLQLKLKPVVGKNIPKPDIEMNLFEEKIFNILNDEPQQIDKIAVETSLPTSEALVHLLSLEFKGLVKQLAGKCFVKA